MTSTEYGPPGATVYYCPLCDWTHTQLPPMEPARLPSGDWALESVEGRLMAVEAALEAHVTTHSVVEWLAEVNRLRSELAKAGPCACSCHVIELPRGDVLRLLRIAAAPLEDVSPEDHRFIDATNRRLEEGSQP